MGNDFCNSADIDEEFEKEQEVDPDKLQQINGENTQLSRMGKEPIHRLAYNINNLPQMCKQSSQLTKIQDLISKLMSHQKRHHKAFTLTKSSNPKNALPDPYLIRSLNAVYVGEWVTQPKNRLLVPGGLGRLYRQDCIIEGEIMTKLINEVHVFDEEAIHSAQQNIFNNRETQIFFKTNVKAVEQEHEHSLQQEQLDEKFIIHVNIMLHGEGRSFTRNQEKRGIFKEGKLDGKGYIRIKNNEDVYEYTGDFKQGKKNGKGIEKLKLTSYDGDFEDDRKKGKGTLILLISRAYDEERLKQEGKLALLDKQIVNRQKNETSSTYKVRVTKQFALKRQKFQQKFTKLIQQKYKWKAPKYLQNSMLFNENILIQHYRRTKFLQNYKGSFQDDKFHGEGTYTWFNGKRYTGQWKKGQMDGIGQFFWPNGVFYRGEYEKDLRHGRGEMIWSIDKRFRGSWAYGMRHGYGEFIEIDSKKEIQGPNIGKTIYTLKVKGALFDKDQLKQTYFTEQTSDIEWFYNVHEKDNQDRWVDLNGFIQEEKEMIAIIKDIRFDKKESKK